MDWSDTERKGLELAVRKDTADKLMIGCLVQYGRSYQRVADRASVQCSLGFAKIKHIIPLTEEAHLGEKKIETSMPCSVQPGRGTLALVRPNIVLYAGLAMDWYGEIDYGMDYRIYSNTNSTA